MKIIESPAPETQTAYKKLEQNYAQFHSLINPLNFS